MKKFVAKIIILIGIVAICMVSLAAFDYFVIGPQYKYNYQASLLDKVSRLKNIKEPKIVLVGHSNLSFGINSEMIQKEFNIPVVNLGLHGGLGNAYHEEIAKQNIGQGDIVIVCHSSFSDNDELSDPALAWVTFDWNDALFPIIRQKDYQKMISAYPGYLIDVLQLWISGAGNQDNKDTSYSRSSFNEYGDVEYKPESEQVNPDEFFKKNKIDVPKLNDTCINRLNNLNNFCLERGATLLVAGYPIAYGKYSDFEESDFMAFQNKLESQLDCDLISNYTDYFYPYSYFYNTTLHLTTEGANIRTQQLVDDIHRWMEKN